MTKATSTSETRGSKGLLAAAATIYVLGVVAHSLWTYYDHPIPTATEEALRAHALRSVGSGVFLLLAALLPMLALCRYTRTKTELTTAHLNAELKHKVARQKEREAELQDAIRDLERFNALAVGRENRILELKGEVNTLLEQQHQKRRYQTVSAE